MIQEFLNKLNADTIVLLLYWLGGIATYWGTVLHKEGISAKQYWVSKPFNSIASLAISTALVITSIQRGDNEFMTYFGVGFVAEAMINRYLSSTGYKDGKNENRDQHGNKSQSHKGVEQDS